jgi:hypothetical protein
LFIIGGEEGEVFDQKSSLLIILNVGRINLNLVYTIFYTIHIA